MNTVGPHHAPPVCTSQVSAQPKQQVLRRKLGRSLLLPSGKPEEAGRRSCLSFHVLRRETIRT